MCHLPYEEILQRLSLHFLQRRRLRADLITAFKVFTGLLDIDPNLFFLPPAGRGLRGHLYKVLQCANHSRNGGSAFSVRVVKYWNKLPVSIVTSPSVNVFPTPSLLPVYHPLTALISLCYPTPCSIYVVSSGPLWPTVYHYKS